jgi:hypothetical protein
VWSALPDMERQVQGLAANFSAFLELFASSLESYAAGGITPSFEPERQ